MKRTPKNYKFFLFDENASGKIAYGGNKILLYPFRNMSVHEFSFPFTGMSRVREALRIKFKPLLGDASSDISIIPFFTGNEKKLSKGCVFLLLGGESRHIEEQAEKTAGDYTVWPAIMAFAGEVEGNGLIIWKKGDFISTIWIDDWTPVYYRSALSKDADRERELALQYASEQGKNIEKVFTADGDELTDEDIQSCGARTLSMYPSYEHLDLSNKGTNLLERREKLIFSLTRACRLVSLLGAILLLLAGGVYFMNRSLLSEAKANTESIYFSSFGERSRQPMSSSLSKVRSLRTAVADTSLHSLLRGITTVWDKIGSDGNIRIETLRYGSDNTDIMGTSENNESIQLLRSILEQEGFVPRVDNIQTIPGGELRFNISISRGKS